ncbi:MAG: hypothetical protein K2P81_10730 [Bacteriovoracaceae bacterium]|nr:hypothetical protein [Bacteriovoracaceae bacterium]
MKFTANFFALMLSLSIATNGYACTEDGSTGLLPENDMYIPVNMKGIKSGLTEEQFNAVIDKVLAVYEPIVSSAGGKLTVSRAWEDGTVNAYASRSGNTWQVAMFGGLARHETITEDGFALVVCHEIGHHIGGAPKKGASVRTGGGGWTGGGTGSSSISWASNEGQADYFATLKCLRKVYLSDDNTSIVRSLGAPAALTKACRKEFKGNKVDSNICIRAGMSGLSVAKLFQALRNQTKAPDFATPDAKVVSSTDDNHPDTQCRLDTYFQGALCGIDDATDVSQTDAKVGTCHTANGDSIGTRPLCWFKP